MSALSTFDSVCARNFRCHFYFRKRFCDGYNDPIDLVRFSPSDEFRPRYARVILDLP
jgi:hypothetical protein